jgi:hypothetical protein
VTILPDVVSLNKRRILSLSCVFANRAPTRETAIPGLAPQGLGGLSRRGSSRSRYSGILVMTQAMQGVGGGLQPARSFNFASSQRDSSPARTKEVGPPETSSTE